MEKSLILDASGNPIEIDKHKPCPKCGAGPNRRQPASGFGQTHLVCISCGHEFKELICPSVIM